MRRLVNNTVIKTIEGKRDMDLIPTLGQSTGFQPQQVAGQAAGAQPPDGHITKLERISIFSTICSAVALGVFASISAKHACGAVDSAWTLWLAVSVGALGGLAHEIAQSGGKILFFERKADGFYLGSLAGMILGAVAGLLSARSFFVEPHPPCAVAQVCFETFMAGLALKGVVEAAGGQPVQGGTQLPPAPQVVTSATQQLGALSLPKPPPQIPVF